MFKRDLVKISKGCPTDKARNFRALPASSLFLTFDFWSIENPVYYKWTLLSNCSATAPSLRFHHISPKWCNTTDGFLCFHSYSFPSAPTPKKTYKGILLKFKSNILFKTFQNLFFHSQIESPLLWSARPHMSYLMSTPFIHFLCLSFLIMQLPSFTLVLFIRILFCKKQIINILGF